MTKINNEIINQYPELKTMMILLPYEDQATLSDFVKQAYGKLAESDETNKLGKRIVTAIYKAEISLSTELIIFGATLALLQGQLTEFRTQISKSNSENPAIYNLLTLELLILKGDNFQAFSYITKSLEVYFALKNATSNYELQDIIRGEEIFTHSLAYYCYNQLGKIEEAENAFEEANRLHAINKYKWNYYYFWLLYFRSRVSFDHKQYEEGLQHIEDAINLCTTHVPHRIYQALTLQLKGRLLVASEQNVAGLKLYLQAQKLFELTTSIFSVSIYADIALLESKVGRYERAKEFFRKTIFNTELLSGGGNDIAPLLQLPGYRGLAELHLIQGSYFSAEEAFLKTVNLAKKTQAVALEAYCLERLGSINTDLRNYETAQNYFISSLNLTTDHQLNKSNTLLEYGRLALLMNNISLAQTQLWYLRSLSQTKHLGLDITLFKAQIMIAEKKFDQARLELEKIQLRTVLKDLFQIRIQIALGKLALNEILSEADLEEEILEEDQIEEFFDRIKTIKPFLEKRGNFPALKIMLILLEILQKWLTGHNTSSDKIYYLEQLEKASSISINQKLVHLSQLINFYKRRFSRKRVRIDVTHLIELVEHLERILILLQSPS